MPPDTERAYRNGLLQGRIAGRAEAIADVKRGLELAARTLATGTDCTELRVALMLEVLAKSVHLYADVGEATG